MKRNEIKRIAKIYAANMLVNAIGSGADSDLLSADDRESLQKELELIAYRLTNESMGFGELDQIIKHVINPTK